MNKRKEDAQHIGDMGYTTDNGSFEPFVRLCLAVEIGLLYWGDTFNDAHKNRIKEHEGIFILNIEACIYLYHMSV